MPTQNSFHVLDSADLCSVLPQVLKDKERLKKRTQLKRSVYRILGQPEDDGAQDNDDSRGRSHSEPERDSHLKDYNENIFDDDDFYHQVCQPLLVMIATRVEFEVRYFFF